MSSGYTNLYFSKTNLKRGEKLENHIEIFQAVMRQYMRETTSTSTKKVNLFDIDYVYETSFPDIGLLIFYLK